MARLYRKLPSHCFESELGINVELSSHIRYSDNRVQRWQDNEFDLLLMTSNTSLNLV